MALLFNKAGRGAKKAGSKQRKGGESPFPGIALKPAQSVSAAQSTGHQFPGIHIGAHPTASGGSPAGGRHLAALSSAEIAEEWNVHVVAVESNRASLCGHRPQMEDMDTCVDYLFASLPPSTTAASSEAATSTESAGVMTLPQLAEYHCSVADWGRNVSCWAVFDGHGGYKASTICAERCFQDIVSDACWKQRRIDEALRNGILRCDEAIIAQANREQWKDGSTGCVALLVDDYLYIGNLGDSEIVLGKRRAPRRAQVAFGSPEHEQHADSTRKQRENPDWFEVQPAVDPPGHQAVLLTEAHSPELPDEKKRIEQAGGVVIKGRLFSDLAVSRAFGDAQYKKPWAEANYISNEPFINRVPLDMTDEFIIIASDGLWDVFKYQEAVDFVSDYLERKVASGRPVALGPLPPDEPADSEIYSEGRLLSSEPAVSSSTSSPLLSLDDAKDNSDSEEQPAADGGEEKDATAAAAAAAVVEASSPPSPTPLPLSSSAPDVFAPGDDSSPAAAAAATAAAGAEAKTDDAGSKLAAASAGSKPGPARSLGALRQMGGMGSLSALGGNKGAAEPKSDAAKKMLDIRNKKQKFKGAITGTMLQNALSKKNHVAARLANEAIKRGSRDNTTVIVVFFQWEEDPTADSDDSDSDSD